MDANNDWRDRISDNNICRYMYAGDLFAVEDSDGEVTGPVSRIRLETNLVFNNPIVAIEIGLKEVIGYLVEDFRIDVKGRYWTGFNSNLLGGWNDDLLKIAMLRGDPTIVETLLSSSLFDMRHLVRAEYNNMLGFFISHASLIVPECFESLCSHQSFDPNFVFHGDGNMAATSPLLSALHAIRELLNGDMDMSPQFRFIRTLLDNGAEPYPLEEELNETPLSLAAGFWFNAKRAQDDDERETLQRLLLMLD